MVKIVNNSGQYKVTLPKDIVDSKGLKGKRVRLLEKGDSFVLRVGESGIKVVDNSGQYKLTLPKDIVEFKGWSSETRLIFNEDLEGNIIIREIR